MKGIYKEMMDSLTQLKTRKYNINQKNARKVFFVCER